MSGKNYSGTFDHTTISKTGKKPKCEEERKFDKSGSKHTSKKSTKNIGSEKALDDFAKKYSDGKSVHIAMPSDASGTVTPYNITKALKKKAAENAMNGDPTLLYKLLGL